ncbi:MAG TPA: MoaD/ThiS family protein [Candidatus Cybelea sp.]|jgi:molybdopterin converting factor subunit 1|nr:MoaD/ThiS family protein [Candidatus Cybelea sp.]
MRIRVLAFARLRELLGAPEITLELPEGARVVDAWSALAQGCSELDEQRASTRAARNGNLVAFEEPLADGDELAILPPVGGG